MIAQRCSAAVVLLGGDGTMRAAAPGLGDTPMLALSTGTNNAFPIMMEATVAGMAVGLIATGRAHAPTARAKVAARRRHPGRPHPPPRDRPGRRVRQHHRRDRLASTLEEPTRFASCTAPLPNPTRSGLSSIPGRIMPTSRSAPERRRRLDRRRPSPVAHRARADSAGTAGNGRPRRAASRCAPGSPATSG